MGVLQVGDVNWGYVKISGQIPSRAKERETMKLD